MSIIGLCGLPGAGKTTAAEELSHGNNDADAYEYAFCPSILEYITQIVYGVVNEDNCARINELLCTRIDPDYANKWRKNMGTYAIVRTKATRSNYPTREMFFSLAVKQITASLFGFSWELVLGATAELRDARENVCSIVSYEHCDKPTVREALQYVGTEMGRDGLHPDIWLNITMRNAQEFIQEYGPTSQVIISDLRFINEADAIRRAGGHIIQIYRKPEDCILTANLRAKHPSVWSFLEFPGAIVTARIHNNGTKSDLADAIRTYVHERT